MMPEAAAAAAGDTPKGIGDKVLDGAGGDLVDVCGSMAHPQLQLSLDRQLEKASRLLPWKRRRRRRCST